MPPLYSGSADEWCFLSTETTGTAVTVEFTIDKFTNQMKKASMLKSHQFSVKDTLWRIVVWPESEDKDSKGHVSVFILNDSDSDEDINVTCKFTLGDAMHGYYGHADDKISGGWRLGFPRFISHEDCKEFLRDGRLTIKVEMSVLEEEETLIHGKGKNFNPGKGSGVNLKIFEDKVFTDFQVVCNGKSFPCHKAFLAARSPVFMKMMESNMKEANEATMKIDCTEIVAENLVKYFYTGQVDAEVLNENSVSFLELGEKFDMAELKSMAEQVMIANLDKENMLSFFLAGDLYHGQQLRAAAKTFLRQNKGSLKEHGGWKEALKERVDLLLELMEALI
eukprot:GFUD01001909.1.p1 GENE.GFUD01001909.1~~GFUD01001909.1.p1  ORF type:complete len:336 (-),score=88.02 GFUD01001909.1:38-1045(-)